MITYCPYPCPAKTQNKVCVCNQCINADYKHIMNNPHNRPKNPIFEKSEINGYGPICNHK